MKETIPSIEAFTYNSFKLTVRQHPVHSRTCGIGERVDRRPIDPPPVVEVQLNYNKHTDRGKSSILSPLSHLFLIAVLIPSDKESQELNLALHTKLTIGRTVSSVYNLRDLDGSEGIFFVFPDISVRIEGNYRLQMCLFKIQGHSVNYITSVLTKQFTVYNAKNFPGMHPSCSLIKSFAAQGLKIRIRTESGPRLSRRTNKKSTRKNTIQKKAGQIDNTSNETSDNHNSVISVNSLLLMDDKEGSKSIIKESSEKEVIDNGNIVFSKDNKQKSQISFKSSCYNPVVDMNEAKKKDNTTISNRLSLSYLLCRTQQESIIRKDNYLNQFC